MTTKKEKKDKFIEGLKDYGLSYDDIIKSGWNYCGGNYKEHYKYYKLRFPNEELLPQEENCVCGHIIKKNGYICNKQETEFLVLGCCCIKKFIGGRKCENCGDKHKRHTINICNFCEKNRRVFENKYKYSKWKRCAGMAEGGRFNCNEKIVDTHSWKKSCYDCYKYKKEMIHMDY
tara:strand:- start:276 stop:800 length:525 start_codon:yes stop_codon:yes gene_type:complete